ncbi:flagellar biosynthetic protein FliR [Frigidibacter oleivorans]|uniref:flagellar biosynthetic protein FliR n=1 Tax=Frigidibacter oleivorans TaxID=2487129 RepID=UPI000F8F2D39|nr:flagellar biosynthetic protein FliR [Frigidibacter oleivorans]
MTPEIAAALLDLATSGGTAAFAVLLRVGAAMALLPAFGEAVLPVRLRLGLALAFTAVVLPAVAPALAGLPAEGIGTVWLLTEPLAGLLLGIGLRLAVMALQIAAAMAAQAMSLAQLFAGAGAEPQPAIGHLLTMGGLALALMSGLPERLARALILSYGVLPAGRMPDPGAVLDWGLAQTGAAFALAFALALPFLLASLLYNLALGIINRAMPQLMVALVGAPAMAAVGLGLVLLAAPAGLLVWRDMLDGLLADPFAVPP